MESKPGSLFHRALRRTELQPSGQALRCVAAIGEQCDQTPGRRVWWELIPPGSRSGTNLTALGITVWPYLDQINKCAESAKQRAINFPANGLASTDTTMERPVRKIFYGTAITASVLLALVLVSYQPYSGTNCILTRKILSMCAL